MLKNEALEQILNDWNWWDRAPPPSIPRERLSNKKIVLTPDLVWVIQGVRRCGKSTLLSQIMVQQGLHPHQCTFVNFEDPRLSEDLDYPLLDQIVALTTQRQTTPQAHYFFLDEIQEVKNWQKWLHAKVERPKNYHFVITGSNATLLSGDLATLLTGRHRTLELFPFSFNEYRIQKPNGTFESYLESGGFPRALQDNRPQELLRTYFTDIIERDVRRHVSARSSVSLSKLVKAVFESTGSEVSQRNLAGMLGITADTVGVYLEACEKAYLLLSCPYFTFSEKQRTARHRKFYPVDLGLRNAIATRTGFDRGKKLETAVFHHLRQHYTEVCYWREGKEVDFVVMSQNGIIPYQVSWDGIQKRHTEALEAFHAAFPSAKPAIMITRENVEKFLNTA